MSTQLPTRQQVDRAAPLDFPDRTTRQELTITIHARVNDFDTEICFSGQLEQLEALTRRLRDLGMSPAGVQQLAPVQSGGTSIAQGGVIPARKAAQRVEPAYDGSGQAICPIHRKPLSEGRYGQYCPSRAEGEHANAKGYCALKFD